LTPSELRESCLHLMSAPLSQLSFIGEHEYIGNLLNEGWIRILLVRRDDIVGYQRLEVEMQTCPTTIEALSQSEATLIGRSLMSYSKYVLRLIEGGFKLEIVESGCIWSLSKEFEDVPDERSFGLLCSYTEIE
jgi:hypothetical protein